MTCSLLTPAILAVCVHAQESSSESRGPLRYTYVDALYQYHDYKKDEVNGGNGFKLALSISPIPILFFTGSAAFSKADSVFESSQVKEFHGALGGGAYLPIGGILHLVGEVGALYSKVNTDLQDLHADNAGLYFKPAVRVALGDRVEVNGGVTLTTVENETTQLNLGLGVDVADHVRVMGQVDFGDTENVISAGLRLQW